MLRANLHPWYHLNSENYLCALPVRELFCASLTYNAAAPLPILSPCNVGSTLEPTEKSLLFGPLLKGYFHNSSAKIYTSHLLSLPSDTMYSSLSLHFLIICSFKLLLL